MSKFKNLLNLMSYTGYCLSPEEGLLIENSLLLLQNDQKFEKIFFWGKILTTSQDYYIAFGYRKDCLRHRRFFYSQNLVNWDFVPNVNKSAYETTLMCDQMFHGDPGLVLDVKMTPNFKMEDDSIKQNDGLVNKLKEEQRLACVVQMISDSTMLVPRGAVYNTVNDIITFNSAFKGLSRQDANEFKNYQLFRQPVNQYNYNLLKRSSYNYSTDFLDTLDCLVPLNKSFALTLERDEEVVVLKSLQWIGAMFLHEVESPLHMACYVGDGKINQDLLFMI